MSKASIIGAYNTQFGAFVKKDKASGLITDTRTYSLRGEVVTQDRPAAG